MKSMIMRKFSLFCSQNAQFLDEKPVLKYKDNSKQAANRLMNDTKYNKAITQICVIHILFGVFMVYAETIGQVKIVLS